MRDSHVFIFFLDFEDFWRKIAKWRKNGKIWEKMGSYTLAKGTHVVA